MVKRIISGISALVLLAGIGTYNYSSNLDTSIVASAAYDSWSDSYSKTYQASDHSFDVRYEYTFDGDYLTVTAYSSNIKKGDTFSDSLVEYSDVTLVNDNWDDYYSELHGSDLNKINYDAMYIVTDGVNEVKLFEANIRPYDMVNSRTVNIKMNGKDTVQLQYRDPLEKVKGAVYRVIKDKYYNLTTGESKDIEYRVYAFNDGTYRILLYNPEEIKYRVCDKITFGEIGFDATALDVIDIPLVNTLNTRERSGVYESNVGDKKFSWLVNDINKELPYIDYNASIATIPAGPIKYIEVKSLASYSRTVSGRENGIMVIGDKQYNLLSNTLENIPDTQEIRDASATWYPLWYNTGDTVMGHSGDIKVDFMRNEDAGNTLEYKITVINDINLDAESNKSWFNGTSRRYLSLGKMQYDPDRYIAYVDDVMCEGTVDIIFNGDLNTKMVDVGATKTIKLVPKGDMVYNSVVTGLGRDVLVKTGHYNPNLDLDNNGDGHANAADAAGILMYSAIKGAGADASKYSNLDAYKMDVNLDGRSNALDAAALLRLSADIGAGNTINWKEYVY